MQTQIGEHGQKLSGGQRQRIAIARALLKDAPSCCWTRPRRPSTPSRRRRCRTPLGRLMEGRTTLAIAHRLSTIEHADVIYCMQDGTIVEQGTHAELLARGGLYAELHALQFT
jgi:ATP-binding cassette, subfamily B, bacterial MsbA